jgi:competence protein ComEC
MAGQSGKPDWPDPGEATPDGGLRCDTQACIYRPDGAEGPLVSIVGDPSALAEDCAGSAFVVSLTPSPGPCPTPYGIIDRFDLWRSGAHAVWISRSGVRIETVAQSQGDRPWAHWPDDRGNDQ